MAAKHRQAIGVLRRFPQQQIYLSTGHGHLWRLEVDDDRILGLVGLRVEVEGRQRGDLIIVEAIKRA